MAVQEHGGDLRKRCFVSGFIPRHACQPGNELESGGLRPRYVPNGCCQVAAGDCELFAQRHLKGTVKLTNAGLENGYKEAIGGF